MTKADLFIKTSLPEIMSVPQASGTAAALLLGLIFTVKGATVTPHHTTKGMRVYRYYPYIFSVAGASMLIGVSSAQIASADRT